MVLFVVLLILIVFLLLFFYIIIFYAVTRGQYCKNSDFALDVLLCINLS